MVEKQWTYKGLPCVIRVIECLGHRCGYVGVPMKREYIFSDKWLENIEVHGGVTYHKNSLEDVERADTYWIGFDCAHIGDVPDPQYNFEGWLQHEPYGGHVWYPAEVMAETEHLADQLLEVI